MTNPTKNDCQLATLAHISILTVLFMGPLSVLIPLIIWFSEKKKNQPSHYSEWQAKQAFFYQTTVYLGIALLSAISALLSLILIGFMLIPIVALLGLAAIGYAIYAGTETWKGRPFRYWFVSDFFNVFVE